MRYIKEILDSLDTKSINIKKLVELSQETITDESADFIEFISSFDNIIIRYNEDTDLLVIENELTAYDEYEGHLQSDYDVNDLADYLEECFSNLVYSTMAGIQYETEENDVMILDYKEILIPGWSRYEIVDKAIDKGYIDLDEWPFMDIYQYDSKIVFLWVGDGDTEVIIDIDSEE